MKGASAEPGVGSAPSPAFEGATGSRSGGECAKAESEGNGEGSLLGHTFNTFRFKAAAGSVLFEIGGGLPSGITGDAGFYLSGSPLTPGEIAAECAASSTGVHQLGFAAVAAGTLQ